MARILVAGFGNVLRADDGFGVAVIDRLQAETLPPDVHLMEVGTGGLRLAQELLTGYDHLIIVDAMTRGGKPGDVYVEEVMSVEPAKDIDMHLAVPARAMGVAKAMGALPPRVHLIGCEPQEVDDLIHELTAKVRLAVPAAVQHVRRLVGADAPVSAHASDAPGGEIARRDEVLQLLYWLEGEGFDGAATLPAIARFLTWNTEETERILVSLCARNDVATRGADILEYKLTETGSREAARRFAEEFTPMLAQGHGECNNPDCDCQAGGPAECRTRR